MMKSSNLRLALAFVSTITVSANADLTPVNGNNGPNGAGGEWNLYDTGMGPWPGSGIMEYLYGAGHFSRVDDSADLLWVGSSYERAGVVGVYAGASQNLYTADVAGGSLSFVLNPSATFGLSPRRFFDGSEVPFAPVSQPFLFLDDAIWYNMAYSDPLLNGGIDRMVTLAVTGYLLTPGDVSSWAPFPDGTTHYVIGFEDYDDFDYQDLVVEVSGVSPVPEPCAATLLGLGVLAIWFRWHQTGRRFSIV